jgi:hypothetical protein
MRNIDNSYAVKLASYLGHVNGLRVKQAFLEGMDPTAQAALLAGGAGAAVGGVGNALFGKRKKGVGILGRLGRGALAGGGIGAGLGAGINEGAIRLGMGRTGADRGTYLSNDWGEEGGTLPVDYAKSMLSDLMNKFKRAPKKEYSLAEGDEMDPRTWAGYGEHRPGAYESFTNDYTGKEEDQEPGKVYHYNTPKE